MNAPAREFAAVVVSIACFAFPSGSVRAQDDSAPAKPPAKNAAASSRINKVTGFMGNDFGTSFDTFKGLVIHEDRGPLKLYTSKDDMTMLGPVKLAEIVYYFYEGKFYGVSLHTEDGQDSTNLLRILQTAYGYGQQSSEDEPNYYWPGKKTSARFSLNTATGDAEAFIYDNKLDHDFDVYEEKACTEAASKL